MHVPARNYQDEIAFGLQVATAIAWREGASLSAGSDLYLGIWSEATKKVCPFIYGKSISLIQLLFVCAGPSFLLGVLKGKSVNACIKPQKTYICSFFSQSCGELG